MNKNIALILLLTIFVACKSEKKQESNKEVKTKTFITDNFELTKPIENSKAVLILFGGMVKNLRI